MQTSYEEGINTIVLKVEQGVRDWGYAFSLLDQEAMLRYRKKEKSKSDRERFLNMTLKPKWTNTWDEYFNPPDFPELVFDDMILASEQLDLTTDLLDALGVMLGFILGFSLIAIAPLSLVSLIVCSPSRQLVAQTLMVWIFIGVLWFSEEMDWLVTTVFLCYALTVIVVWLRGTLGKGAT